jgi:UDP-glucose 4-epimerase
MNISIIGASGFLGRHLCRALIERGDTVFAYDVAHSDKLPAKCHFEKLNIVKDNILLPKATDAVFYLAQSPHYHDFPEQADHLFAVNSWGPVKVAEAARKTGAKAFLYASTGNVYMPSFDALAENALVCRDDAYALSKLMGEEGLRLYKTFFKTVVFRPFGLFGPGQTAMLPVKIRSTIEGGAPVTVAPRPGEDANDAGGMEISLCYIHDAVQALVKLLDSAVADGVGEQTINLAGGDPISIRRLAKAIAETLSREVRFVAVTPRKKNLIADVNRLVAATGIEFTPFETAMRETLLKNNGRST